MKKFLLLVPSLLFISTLSSASLLTIPTEFTVRCGIAEDSASLKIATSLDQVFVCKSGRPQNPNFYGSTISGEEKVAVSIGTNIFSETTLYSFGIPEQAKYQLSNESCENVNSITLIINDSKSGIEYGLDIHQDDITIYQNGNEICKGKKK
jgi:hypothetical protein